APVPLEGGHFALRLHIPQLHGLVPTATGQQAPIRGKRHGPDRAPVPLEGGLLIMIEPPEVIPGKAPYILLSALGSTREKFVEQFLRTRIVAFRKGILGEVQIGNVVKLTVGFVAFLCVLVLFLCVLLLFLCVLLLFLCVLLLFLCVLLL